jgi:adenylate cyclase
MRAGLLATALLASAALLLPGPASELREAATDLLMAAAPRRTGTAPVLAVAVTEEDLALIGPWPWPRERLAELVSRLASAQPAALALDLAFPEATTGDTALEVALAGTRSVQALLGGTSPPPHGFPVAQLGRPDLSGLMTLPGVEPSAIKGTSGALAVLPGRVVRALPLVARIGPAGGKQLLPGFALGALVRALELETVLLRGESSVALQLGSFLLELPSDGLLRLDPPRDAVPMIAAGAVLRGEMEPGAVHGRIVVVGVTAPEAAPLRPSALGPFTPSLLVQAEAVAQLAVGWIPQRPRHARAAETVATLLLGLGAATAVRRRVLGGLLLSAGAAVLWPVLTLIALREGGLLMDPAIPAFGSLAGGMAEAATAAHRLARERARLLSRFTHRLPTGVAEQLLARPQAERLRPELCRVAVVMTDLSGFFAMVRHGEPARVIALLNAYLAGIEEAVLAESGTLERLIGDSVLAVFGAPLARPDDTTRALAAARAIDRFAEDFRRRPEAMALGWGETRIGVAAGEVLAGEVGGSRLTWAVCGDAANVAARLQELGKSLGRRGLVSGIEDASLPPPIGRFSLRGLDGQVEVRPLD